MFKVAITVNKTLIATRFPPNRDPWLPYTVWDFFLPAFNCPHEVERIGALGDGGKWVCGLSRLEDKPDCVIYSFGKLPRITFIQHFTNIVQVSTTNLLSRLDS